jgi:acyl carrier protein
MSMRLTIMDEMTQIAREHGRALVSLDDDLALHDCGLDSLAVAVLVARLEDQFEVNPFATSEEEVQLPVTIGDFVRAYEDGACRSAVLVPSY